MYMLATMLYFCPKLFYDTEYNHLCIRLVSLCNFTYN